MKMLGVASWNIAGGHISAQAPKKGYGAEDQRARLMAEILRWERAFGVDVVVLQECEERTAYRELSKVYELVGAVEAVANRGFVHVYVRLRVGIEFEQVDVGKVDPCVAVRVDFDPDGAGKQSLVLVAVHLPAGDAVDARKRILARVLKKLGDRCKDRLLLVGDMNVNKDGEAHELCDALQMKEERYEGFSWGVPGNRFYEDMTGGGRGLRKDRVFFGDKVWAKAHLVGQCEQFFDGCKFHLSDHFGVMSYVDVSTVYGSTARKQDVIAARARRAEVASFMRQCQQKDQVETRALQQRGRDSQALEQQRARERDRESILQEQRRAARQRRSRAERLRRDAFGPDCLFADGVVSVPALYEGVPVGPAEVGIPGLSDVPRGAFSAAEAVPLRGLRRGSTNMCYVICAAQVMIRTPGMLEWLQKHNEDGCPHERTSCVLCGLFLTWTQVFAGCSRGAEFPRLADRRHHVADVFANNEQQDAVAFIEGFLDKVRRGSLCSMGSRAADGSASCHPCRSFVRLRAGGTAPLYGLSACDVVVYG